MITTETAPEEGDANKINTDTDVSRQSAQQGLAHHGSQGGLEPTSTSKTPCLSHGKHTDKEAYGVHSTYTQP